jgi:acetate kinase
MNILVLNAGSSSLKFQVIETSLDAIQHDTDRTLASGLIERIGSQALVTLNRHGENGKPEKTWKSAQALRNFNAAIDLVLRWLVSDASEIPSIKSLADIHAIGNRVVHGGEKFTKSVVITDDVMRALEDMIELAPLHNPANIAGIRAARELLGVGVPQVAVFDTAFHHTLPEHAYLYAIPYQYYRRYKIRRYGFHGTSHRYVAYKYRKMLGLERTNTHAISLHLGNGCSACAITRGDSIDTSMGLTPLEGLVMGTRSGDVDPAVIEYMALKEGMSIEEVDSVLNRLSGLLGISGLTNDMRELLEEEREHNDRRARLAIDLFCYRARKYIGSYLASIAAANPDVRAGAVIFTGGIGENSSEIRSRITQGLEWFGLELDPEKNQKAVGGWAGCISKDAPPSDRPSLKAYVIPTNEELLIARDTLRSIENIPQRF